MKFAVVFAVLVGCATAFANTRCHEGPSYWCSSQETATECAATEFCTQNYWQAEEKSGEVGNYVTCKACTWAFSMIESYVFTTANENAILNFTAKLCDHIPAAYTVTCKEMINEYGITALNTLIAKLNPTMVCTALGQCSKASLTAQLLPKETTCGVCKQSMDEVREQTEELFTWWQSACSDAKDTAGCVTYSEMALLLNKAVLNEHTCEEMQMC